MGYTFAAEKRVIWESKVKENVRKCYIVTPNPTQINQETTARMLAGIAI